MAKGNFPLLAFNRGIVSRRAIARVDVDRVRLSAEEMTNWLPMTAGSMMLRPGFEYGGTSRNNAFAITIPFIAATNDTAELELADGKMRVRVDDELITRVAVSTLISNSNFASATGWTDASTHGGTCGFGVGGLTLNAVNVGGLAICRRQVAVAVGDQNKRHALEIEVTRGPLLFRCGSTSGGDEYIAETTLRTGHHSLAFTPTGNFYVQFQSDLDIDRIVASCAIAIPNVLELDIPYAANDLPYVRWDQSADVIFLACDGHQQRRIERRDTDSWSFVVYAPEDGPFFAARTAKVKLKVSATNGNTTLSSDLPFFSEEHAGAIFRLFNEGFRQSFKLGAAGTYSEPFRVTGIFDGEAGYNDRDWHYTISGTWAGTLRWYRSFDGEDTGFKQFRYTKQSSTIDITANPPGNVPNEDSDNNAIVYYKIGFDGSSYTSGTATVNIVYDGGGGYGVCRITAVNSPTEAEVEILNRFNDNVFTENWQEGIWSLRRGWPSAVGFHKGRLWWAGKSRFIGSVADDFESFDPDFEGDAGPINRTIGAGPVDKINFLLSLSRLAMGTPGSEYSVKSTSFDEPLTPDNTQAGDPSTQGSREGVGAIKIDNRGIFVQRSGKRIFELIFNPDTMDYEPHDLTLLCPELTGSAKVMWMAVQRQPDTRVHMGLSDGAVILLTYEPSEDVTCWSRLEMADDGFVEGASVRPSEDEDTVCYWVRRTVNGQTVRYREKMALESECVGGDLNKQMDSFRVIEGVTGQNIIGFSHLEGKTVAAWASGRYLGTFPVSAGQFAVDAELDGEDVVAGLPYEARYKSTKLAYAAAAGTALTQRKKVNFLGAILQYTHNDGLYFGPSYSQLDPMPRVIDGVEVDRDDIYEEFDKPAFEFPGEWDSDSRLHLKAFSPKPCELLAAVLSIETNERV